MRKHIQTIVIIAAVLLLGGCEKVLEIDDTGADDLMVLNAVPQANKRAFLNFSNTAFFLDTVTTHPVAGANITLWRNGVPLYPDSVGRCNYFFPDTLRSGDQLRAVISTPKGEVTAETYVPPVPKMKLNFLVEWASPTFNFITAIPQFSDSANFAEYYQLTVTVRDSGMRHEVYADRYRTIDTVSHTYFILNDNNEITSNDVSPNLPLGGYLYSSLMFIDRQIDGCTDYPINLFIPIYKDTNEVVNDTQDFKHWYTITMESITPARMKYLISVARANSMGSAFAEQAQAYSNVNGAVGIFAGSAKWSHTFMTDTLMHFDTPNIPIPVPSKLPRRN